MLDLETWIDFWVFKIINEIKIRKTALLFKEKALEEWDTVKKTKRLPKN